MEVLDQDLRVSSLKLLSASLFYLLFCPFFPKKTLHLKKEKSTSKEKTVIVIIFDTGFFSVNLQCIPFFSWTKQQQKIESIFDNWQLLKVKL